MKTVLRYAFSILAAIAVISSCDKTQPEEHNGQETQTPVFPTTTINETVKAGASVDLHFEANLKWKIEISGEGKGNMFWLDDEGMKATSISNDKTGPQVVTIVFSEDEEFDKNRVCDVTLTMGGESKKIATYTRLSLSRTFEVYAGVVDEFGFKKISGAYEYGEETVTTAELTTFEGNTTYVLPLKVVTNYAWNLVLPSWASSETLQGTAGVTELFLEAVLSDDVAAGAKENLRFVDVSNTAQAFELELSLPDFGERVEINFGTTLEFDSAGLVKNLNDSFIEIPAFFELLSTPATTVKVVDWNEEGQYYGTTFSQWVEMTKERYDDYTEEDALAKFTVEFRVPANETYDDRYADVFVLPASVAEVALDDWFDPNTGNLKEEFSAYIVGRIYQVGLDRDYITLSENEEDVYEAELAKYTEEPWWGSFMMTDNLFELVYKNEYSDAVLVFDEPFASFKYFDYDFVEVEEADVENFWLQLNCFASNQKGRVTMYPELFNRDDAEFPESFIVFYDEDENEIGVLACRYTSKTSVITGDVLALESGEAELIKLDDESEMKMFLASEFGNMGVLDVYQLSTSDKQVVFTSQVEAWNHRILTAVPPMTDWEDAPFAFENQASVFGIFMGENVTEPVESIILLQAPGADGETLLNFVAIHYIYTPEEGDVTPDDPEIPEDPETPDDPDTPVTPEDPSDPETPEDPSDPETPEDPSDPETPENPSDPETPEDPSDPEIPEDPSDPETPDTPVTPEEPSDPETPEEPEVPVGPEIDETGTKVYSIGAGSGELIKYGTGSTKYHALKSKYGITEVYHLTSGDKKVYLSGNSEISDIYFIDIDSLEPVSQGSEITCEGSDKGFNVYFRTTSAADALLLVEGSEGYFAAVYLTFDPTMEIDSPFAFVNPSSVAGKATLGKYTGEYLDAILAEFGGQGFDSIDARYVYELKYTSTSVKAQITIPSTPANDGAAWNNYPISSSYWLTGKVSGQKMTVTMKKSGQTDWFVFATAEGNWSWILVCTCE